MRVKLVLQQHQYGCGIACIAMITGKPYHEILESFITDFDKTGMTESVLMEYMSDTGKYEIAKRSVEYFNNRDFMREDILTPFAPAHIISMRPYIDSEMWHFVVMDGKGKMYCPSGTPDSELRTLYQFGASIGFFKI